MKRILVSLAVAVSLSVSPPAFAGKISRDQLVTMFANMRANTPWNVDGPLLWGYFFTAQSRAALEPMAKVLVGQGYRLAGIYLGDKASPTDPDVWWLRVERVEKHTEDSLDTRNNEFYRLARKSDGIEYDGMDVGPAS